MNGEGYGGIERRKWEAILRGDDYFMCRLRVVERGGMRYDEDGPTVSNLSHLVASATDTMRDFTKEF